MSQLINHLIDCLREKESLLEKLILLLDDEQNRIVHLDAAGLESCTEEKNRALNALARKKACCREALDSVARDVSLPADGNLSAILEKVGSPDSRAVLENLQRRIIELVDSLNRINNVNRDLLTSSLSLVNRSLDFFAGRMGTVRTYGDTGRVESRVPGGSFVRAEM